jgi:V/A-type H+/Na+-transporting ATPase subunit C
MAMLGNTPYVAARAKSRRQKLADRARLRQLINQSPEQMTVAVGDLGYRAEMDLYAGKYSGGDLVEAALTHNLEHELKEIVGMCNGAIRAMVEVYTLRFEYQNAKVVLRAVINDVDQDKVLNNILPALNDINTPWLKMIENADDLRSAATQMRRMSFGPDLMSLPDDARLADYENALDRHYFKRSLASLSLKGAGVRFLRDLLKSEIDHRNILNIIEAEAVGIDNDDILEMLIPGGRLIPERAFSSIAAGGKKAALDILRGANRFDMQEFEGALAEAKSVNSLDPVITWFNAREHALLQRMSYLHPVSALPVVNYVAMKVQEVADLRLIVRGRLAGLPTEVLEAHIL